MLTPIKKEYVLYIPDYNKFVAGISDKYILMKSDKNEALHFSTKSYAIDFIKNNNLKNEDYRIVCLNNSFYLIVNIFLFATITILAFMENDFNYYFIAKVLYNILIFVTIGFNAYYLKE